TLGRLAQGVDFGPDFGPSGARCPSRSARSPPISHPMAAGDSPTRGARSTCRRALTACLVTLLALTGAVAIGASPAAAGGTPTLDSSPSNPTLADPLVWTFSGASPVVCQLADPNGTTIIS